MIKLAHVLLLLVAGWLLPVQAHADTAPVASGTKVWCLQSDLILAAGNAYYMCGTDRGSPSVFCAVPPNDLWQAPQCYSNGYNLSIQYQYFDSASCPAGTQLQNGVCKTYNPCTAGTISTHNFTIGWARDSVSDPPRLVGGEASIPLSSCNGTCKVDTDAITSCWTSTETGPNGLYRVSCDARTVSTATQCTTKEQALDKQAPPTPCPGSVGEFNGKTICVGTAASPIVPKAADQTVGKPMAQGNPAAGEVPKTGDGSGVGGFSRTPTNGNGGNAGGPASAGGGGTVLLPGQKAAGPSGTEQAACGAPGQPQCAVKVDESGVPTSDGLYTSSNNALNQAETDRNNGLNAAIGDDGKDTSWALPSWLSSGSCAPVTLMTLPPKLGGTAINFDICPELPLIHLLMNWLWSLWTFFIVVNMVFRVTTKTGE